MKPWFVYILRCSDRTLYAGVTNDLPRREKEHNKNTGAKYTRGRGPAKMIYTKECESRSAALKEEARIKNLTRKEKLSLVKHFKGKPKDLPTKLFQVVNEGFTCNNCGEKVLPTTCGTPRNHCPFCLYSKHVDTHVGDRANPCRGMMKPIGVLSAARKEYIIVHKCAKCGGLMRSKIIPSRDIQPDDFDLVVKLSTRPIHES
jgi:predicted GIY-YIG superfamily endonuclease